MASLAATLTGLANPKRFLDLSGLLIPWIAAAALVLFAVGTYWALFATPPDYQQRESVKIMFIHVPAAVLSMFVYVVIAAASLTGLVFKHPLADISAKAAAPLGAAFAFLALFTGALWGKPTWGTYWVWDAIEDPVRAARIAAILALVGAVDVVIIHYSVEWWNTLHQPASILRADGPTIDPSFLWPLFIMWVAYTLLFVWCWLLRIRTEIFRRRARSLMLAKGAAA